MILDPTCAPRYRRSTLVSHLSETLQSACGSSPTLNTQALEEVAQAVECVLGDTRTAFVVDSDHLLLLASRALRSLGHGEEARRLVLYGTGLVRPSVWEATGGAAGWVLDLKRMTVLEGPNLEMIFFAGLRLVLESMADVWDAGSGAGVLGLKHVCATATALIGTDRPADREHAAGEIVLNCEQVLRQLGRRRGWRDTPRVMNLDIR